MARLFFRIIPMKRSPPRLTLILGVPMLICAGAATLTGADATSRFFPGDTRLASALQTMAASPFAKCTDGTRVKMGASPHQLAALPLVAK